MSAYPRIPVHFVPAIGSTMDAALASAPSPVGGRWFRTWHQWRGRGRRGSAWQDSPGDSLLASLVVERGGPLDPSDRNPATIALRAAAALASVFERHAAPAVVTIKWPNDILVDDRKVSGILVESRSSRHVLGLGINLTASAWPGAASLSGGRPIGSEALFAEVGEAIVEFLKPDSRWHREVSARLAWVGREVAIGSRAPEEDSTTRRGLLVGLADDGALLVDEGGVVSPVFTGSPRLLNESSSPTTVE